MTRTRAPKIGQRQRITVIGNVPFPIDMLRYDACYPDTETDSYGITASFEARNFEARNGRMVRVSVIMIHDPTEGRWMSFGWRIIGRELVV